MAVKGVILDESVLFLDSEDDDGNLTLRSEADSLLRKLRYSMFRTGICYALDLSAHKVSLIKKTAKEYSVDCFTLHAPSSDDATDEIMLAWGDIGGSVLHLISSARKNAYQHINYGGLIIVLNVEGGSACENPGIISINKLEELPLSIIRLNRKAIGNGVLRVGYIMKRSREDDFIKRGAFPMYPTGNGLIFLPLTFDLSLSSQLAEVDMVLHKSTDEILSIDLSNSSELCNRVLYTEGMQELQRYIEHHPDCCVIDPLNNIYPVLDRLEIQMILLGLENLRTEGGCTIRGPHFLKVDDLNEPNLVHKFSATKLSLPCIVKPQVACGVAHAHSMAIVFKVEDFKDLDVPIPAVIQEYVDHSSRLYKFYVLGDKVFYAVKKSTPNTKILRKLCSNIQLKPLVFDSLKSLPTANENQHSGNENCSIDNNEIDIALVTKAANLLLRMLDLTVFGFDVVIQEGTGDHVIVDVNYLPSFKEVPDNIAIPAFWDAIKKKFELKRLNKQL